MAGAAIAAVLAQLIIAQVTLGFTVCLVIIGRLARWRRLWLVGPAAIGLAWMLAGAARPAVAGYLAGADHIISHLARPGPAAVRLARLRSVLASWRRWLPDQAPAALPVAVAEAAVIGLLGRRGAARPYRPGAVVAARRAYLTWSTGRGELATADGGCVGIAWNTGRRASVSWREAAGGVLCTGQSAAAVTATGLALTLAAIAHRKTVIAIDLAGGEPGAWHADVAGSIEPACAAAGAPLRDFGGALGCYDPLGAARAHGTGEHCAGLRATGRPEAADLILAMIDWTGVGQARQRFCADYLTAAVIVIAAASADRARPPARLLDELGRLLEPGSLRAAVREVARHSAALDPLADQLTELAAQLDAEPAALAPAAGQLAELRAAAIGRRLSRSTGDAGISLRRAVADREVVLFSLDRDLNGWPAAMIARLALADLTTILAGRRALGAPADCLVWVNGCEAAAPRQLAALAGVAARSGTAVLLGTAADAAAARLADHVNVVAIRGPAPPSLGRPAPEAPAGPAGSPARASFGTTGGPPLPPRLLARQAGDAVSLYVRDPRPRLLTGCRAVR